jgi:ribonucleoside-diphosphate reductase alpha chain
MECFGTVASVSLQHGVPLKVLCEKRLHTRFEPSGWTGNESIGYAKSIMDYIFRWIEARLPAGDQLPLFDIPVGWKPHNKGDIASFPTPASKNEETHVPGDAPRVSRAALSVPKGSCFKCVNCEGTSGCS